MLVIVHKNIARIWALMTSGLINHPSNTYYIVIHTCRPPEPNESMSVSYPSNVEIQWLHGYQSHDPWQRGKGTPQNLSRPNSGREQLRLHYLSRYKDDPLPIIHPSEWYLTMKWAFQKSQFLAER